MKSLNDFVYKHIYEDINPTINKVLITEGLKQKTKIQKIYKNTWNSTYFPSTAVQHESFNKVTYKHNSEYSYYILLEPNFYYMIFKVKYTNRSI